MGLKFEPKKFKFGMRTLKTGIAVFLVLGLFSAFGWDGLQICKYSWGAFIAFILFCEYVV